MASTIAALTADMTNVVAPLVCTRMVMGVDALQLGPLGRDLALVLVCCRWMTKVPLPVLHGR